MTSTTLKKRFLLQMMETVQLARTKVFDTQINIHSLIHNSYVSLAQEFQKHLADA